MSSALVISDVTIALGARRLIERLSLTTARGVVTTLMGPSGSGKSTLLAYVCGTLDPAFDASGSVTVDGEDITALPPERRRIGILFQDDLLFPHLSVGGNLSFGLAPRLKGRAARRARIERALAEIDMAGFADRDPATLSGGQRARVALARALLSEPRALLLDEPFSKLDAALKQRFRRFVFDHATAHGLPVLLVTHDPDDAEAAGGPVHVLGGFHDTE
ncbi:MAG: ATP-binding cassette domain-containing protein [Alphaproteobacteria bacterium]|nr:ATP-binding cassette domain-containing protein [Alphaproteobacteria bacterium]